MANVLSRRDLLLAGAAALVPTLAPRIRRDRATVARDPLPSLADIERRVGGRLGVAVLDTGSGRRIGHRADERFPMCSTFKLLLAAMVLSRVDAGRESLERVLPYGEADLLDYAPITRAHVHEGGMSVAALCAAAIEYSDNTAANVLLRTIGGPSALTGYLRSLGDPSTRLDRTEPTLNSAIPGDPRDTTTPAAMLEDVRRVVLGDALSGHSRDLLRGWLVANTTGAGKLRAGLPPGWRVGDKTGSGAHGATNDVAVLWPTAKAPVLVAAYLVDTAAPAGERNAALADVGRIVAAAIAAG